MKSNRNNFGAGFSQSFTSDTNLTKMANESVGHFIKTGEAKLLPPGNQVSTYLRLQSEFKSSTTPSIGTVLIPKPDKTSNFTDMLAKGESAISTLINNHVPGLGQYIGKKIEFADTLLTFNNKLNNSVTNHKPLGEAALCSAVGTGVESTLSTIGYGSLWTGAASIVTGDTILGSHGPAGYIAAAALLSAGMPRVANVSKAVGNMAEEACYKLADDKLAVKSTQMQLTKPERTYTAWEALKNEFKPAPLLKQKVIVLTGPRTFGLVSFTSGVKNQNPFAEVVEIGDGFKDLTVKEMNDLYSHIANNQDRTLLIIDTHGCVINDNHMIQIHDKGSDIEDLISTEDFLEEIAKKLSGRPIDIFMTSCNSGAIQPHLEKLLPAGSNFVGLSPATDGTYVRDVFRLNYNLNTDNMINGKITAKNLLETYLMTSLQHDVPPFINKSNVPTMLANDTNQKPGVKFAKEEEEIIHKHLDKYDPMKQLDEAISIMKNTSLAGTPLYGKGLAAIQIGKGELGKTNLTEHSSVTPRLFTNDHLGKLDKSLSNNNPGYNFSLSRA